MGYFKSTVLRRSLFTIFFQILRDCTYNLFDLVMYKAKECDGPVCRTFWFQGYIYTKANWVRFWYNQALAHFILIRILKKIENCFACFPTSSVVLHNLSVSHVNVKGNETNWDVTHTLYPNAKDKASQSQLKTHQRNTLLPVLLIDCKKEKGLSGCYVNNWDPVLFLLSSDTIAHLHRRDKRSRAIFVDMHKVLLNTYLRGSCSLTSAHVFLCPASSTTTSAPESFCENVIPVVVSFQFMPLTKGRRFKVQNRLSPAPWAILSIGVELTLHTVLFWLLNFLFTALFHSSSTNLPLYPSRLSSLTVLEEQEAMKEVAQNQVWKMPARRLFLSHAQHGEVWRVPQRPKNNYSYFVLLVSWNRTWCAAKQHW